LRTRMVCRRFGSARLAAARPRLGTPPLARPHARTQRHGRRRFADATVPVTFVDSRDGQTYDIEAKVGQTVLDAALDQDVDIEAACGGELACSTCHVVLEQGLYDALDAPDDEEEDMLDLAWGLEGTSRLCCQIKVTPDLKGAKFVIPEDPDI